MQYKSSFFFIYFENFGVLLVWVGFLYTHIDSQKHKVFFILPRHFRGKLLPWYSDRLSLVSTTIVLTRAPYNLFGKPLFSQFHTEPHSGLELCKKTLVVYLLYLKPPKRWYFSMFIVGISIIPTLRVIRGKSSRWFRFCET